MSMAMAELESFTDNEESLLKTIITEPYIVDKTGESFLNVFDKAIAKCRKLIVRGYVLTHYLCHLDGRIEFTLKKNESM